MSDAELHGLESCEGPQRFPKMGSIVVRGRRAVPCEEDAAPFSMDRRNPLKRLDISGTNNSIPTKIPKHVEVLKLMLGGLRRRPNGGSSWVYEKIDANLHSKDDFLIEQWGYFKVDRATGL